MRMDLRSLGVTVAMTMLLVLQTTHRVNGEPLNKVWTLHGGTAKDLDPEGITFFHAGSDPKPSENDVHTFSRVLPNDILLSKTVERLAKTKPSLRSSWSHFGGFFPQSESQNDMGMVFSKKSAFKTETLPVFMGNSDTTKKKPTNHVASFAPTNTNDLDAPSPSDFIGENTLQTKLDTPSAADNPFLIFETGNAPVDQGFGLNTLATGSETGGDLPFSSFGSRFNSDFDSSTNTGTDNNAVLSSSPDSNGITFIDNSVGSESSIFGRVSSGNVNSDPFDSFMAGNKNSVDLSSMSDNAKSRESTNTFDFDTNLNSAPTDFTQLGISDVSTGPIYPMDTLGVSPTENKVRIKPLPTFSTDFAFKNSMRPKLTMQVMNNFAAKTTTTPAPPTSQNIKKPTMMITGQFKDQSKGPRFMVKSKFVDLSHIKKEEPTTTTKSTPAEVEPKPTALTPTEITKPSTNSKTPPVTTTINESPSTTLQVDATSDLSQAANSKNPGNKGLKVDFLYPPAPFPSKPETNSDDTSSSINAEQPVNADTKDLIAITGGTKTESVASDVATHLDIPHVRHTNHILGRNTDDRFVTEPDVQVLNKEDVDNSNPGTGAFPNVAPTAEVPGLSTTEFIPLDRIKTNTELNENQLMNIGQTGGFNQNGPTVDQALPTNNRGNLWNNQQASQASGNAQTFAQQNPNFGNMGTNGSPQNSFANPNINNNQQNGFTNPNLRQFPNIQQQQQQFSLQNQQNLGMLVPGFNQGQMLGLPNDGQFMNFGPNQFGQMRPGPMQDMFGPARPPAGRPMMPFAG
ncbi:uncharacterized protein LOC128221574 [Mya arenaria]|uniref:uncharacterized protein LOC128221574 n=1 Tax=Mya arenaria TaxID=6604 RepID=UPI0022DEE616|nr:uncharacterized protein LOC128221574 [Mya arenaria]